MHILSHPAAPGKPRLTLFNGAVVCYNGPGGDQVKDFENICHIAVVQAAPVMFDAAACTDKAARLIDEAAQHGAKLIVFPELFIPGYPYGLNFGFSVGHRDENMRPDWARYAQNSILVPGRETDVLCERARAHDVWVSIGVSERDAVTGTLYNSNVFITPHGEVHSCHRKLKPTGSERVVWGDADRAYFPVAETPWGVMGSMICWESYMPLARAALYQKGVGLYVSPNTNDNDEWQCTIRHIALEGRCYFINCDMYFTRDMYPDWLHECEAISSLDAIVCRGGSCIVDPHGHYVTEPLWDREGIIYADLDMTKLPASRMEFDPCGHYSRPDVLKLNVLDI